MLHVDRFGNCITNIERRDVDKVLQGAAATISAGPHEIARIVTTYDEAAGTEPCALFGSTDHLEIAVKSGSAAERLSLTRGHAGGGQAAAATVSQGGWPPAAAHTGPPSLLR